MAAKARAYMAEHPGVGYQKALDELKSPRSWSGPYPDRPEDLPSWLKALGIADINTHDFEKGWAASSATNSLRIPIGYVCNDPDPDGQRIRYTATPELAYLDIAENRVGGSGPHGALHGMTGSGLTYLEAGLVGGLAVLHGPDKARFLLLDGQGGTAFHGFSRLPHTIGNYSRLRENWELFNEICQGIAGEVARRRALLARFSAADAFSYRKMREGDPQLPEMPALVIVAHNLLDRKAMEPKQASVFDTVLDVGQAAGVHLVVCNMGHSEVVPAEWAKSWTFGISMKTVSGGWSRAVVGDDSAEMIPFQIARLRCDGSESGVRTFVEFDVEELVGDEPADASAKAIRRLIARMAGPPRPCQIRWPEQG
ncbi:MULTISPECIES: FtsK/SpoIIIE domain-containing protein [Mycolicibacter]|uniref:FtsK/SpoIIIE domain-containing protein n=2 Tax=Mycolicibacter TaxID=1073531 RepID=A0ABU5XN11_9MYCO|nr:MULTISPECIES: FtsK/SpoIIIE domain-containing protein [unclassified Mycolicibacter]MEB3023373.1 FtsK/SpoIIIE domain-containing protein [Mycolicibacter sp. MYC098]MEB3033715.1 FtsK/SpoIIIE domain-containing protein [Mycolicibacter sp. MYC340]